METMRSGVEGFEESESREYEDSYSELSDFMRPNGEDRSRVSPVLTSVTSVQFDGERVLRHSAEHSRSPGNGRVTCPKCESERYEYTYNRMYNCHEWLCKNCGFYKEDRVYPDHLQLLPEDFQGISKSRQHTCIYCERVFDSPIRKREHCFRRECIAKHAEIQREKNREAVRKMMAKKKELGDNYVKIRTNKKSGIHVLPNNGDV